MNPCGVPKIRKERGLLCPDLTISRPSDLQADRAGGNWVLRATSSVNSVGRGPAELHGRRHGWHSMRASQRVHKKDGGLARFHTNAKLHFKQIPGQGRYWKFHNAARFELWSLNRKGEREAAIAEWREAIRLKKDHAEAHINLGSLLKRQGDFRAGLELIRRGHELGSRDPRWPYPSAKWVREAERSVQLDDKLMAILDGKAGPASSTEPT